MGKQQNQIEEMKKSCTDCIHYEICSLWTTTDLDEDEAYKYCFGNYKPKTFENAVMLTREEVKIYQKIYDFMKEKGIVSVEEMKTLISFALKSSMLKSHIVKETAEKFAEMLKSDVSEDNELHERLNYYLKRDYFEYIDERCKELMEGK